jgi:hypothetical protein
MESEIQMAYADGDWQCAIESHAGTTTFVNSICVKTDPGQAAADVAAAVAAAWGSNDGISAILSSAVILDLVTAQDLTLAQASNTSDFSGAANDNGQSGSGRQGPQCSLVCTLLTGAGGRSGRGRLFLGGVSTDYVDGGREFYNDSGGDLQAALDATLAILDGSGPTAAQWALNSRKNSLTESLTSIRVNLQYIGTQRRRAERFE